MKTLVLVTVSALLLCACAKNERQVMWDNLNYSSAQADPSGI